MAKKAIERSNLSDVVVSRIKDLILNNSLKSGDRLPTEQEMADEYGVSRLCVREATKALSFFGIIDSAPRRGLTIGQVNMDKITEIISFHLAIEGYSNELLLKSRMVVEIGSLQYVMEAMREEPALYNDLISVCDELEKHIKDPDRYVQLDNEFHSLLVKTSKLEPLFTFNDILQIFFVRFRKNVLKHSSKQLAEGARMHRTIVEALHEGNLVEGEKILRYHLEAHKGITV